MIASHRPPSRFWIRWLQAALGTMLLTSLVPLLLPQLGLAGMSLLVFADPYALAAGEPRFVRYIEFVHGVLGAVMIGWSVALLLIVRGPLSCGLRPAWNVVAASICAWFLPGVLFSAWLGVWPNVLVDGACFFAFAIPLVAIRRSLKST